MRSNLLLLALFLSSIPGVADDSGWKIAPRPEWVTDVAWKRPTARPDETPNGGVEYLLFDKQIDRRGRPATYVHTVKHLVNEVGVQSDSEVEIYFDSLYQEVHLHSIRLHRNGETLDRLRGASLDVTRRESSREEELFQATRAIRAYVDDVRVGDVLEYEFTILGENPVFAGQYLDGIQLRWSVPVGRVHRSLLWSADRPIHFLPLQTERLPERRQEGRSIRFEWDESPSPAVTIDEDHPPWYDPFPWIQVSSFASWSEVVDWGRALFDVSEPAPPELKRQVLELAGPERDEAAIVRAGLRIVQDEIRYLYIGLADSSHRPSRPGQVYERRFGDCKDKSLLLVTLLRELGIDAVPALVNTRYGAHVTEFLPSPAVFNHVIVRVKTEGKTYWVDGTVTRQRGSLDVLAPPEMAAALVLAEGVEAFETVPSPKLDEPGTEIFARLELGDGRLPVELSIETTYRGSRADDLRFSLGARSQQELQREFVEFYTNLYPSVESTAPISWTDDTDLNVLRVHEQYRVPEFWRPGDYGAWVYGELYPLELEHLLTAPSTAERTSPLSIAHPIHLRYVIEAAFDESWQVVAETNTVESDGFALEQSIGVQGRVLRLDYRIRSRVDHLPPEAVSEHAARLAEGLALLSYPIQLPVGPEGVSSIGIRDVNWPMALTALLVLIVAIFLAIRVHRWRPETGPPDPARDESAPKGLGGWLVLVGFGVVLFPIQVAVDLFTSLPAYSLPNWNSLTTPASDSFHPLWAPVMLGELVLNLFLFVASLLVLALFFRKRRSFPIVFIVLIVATPILIGADSLVASLLPGVEADPGERAALVGMALRAALWSWYTLASRRVRNTFVN